MGAIITNLGLNLVLDGFSTRSKTVISQFKVGTGTTEPALADTDLETPVELTAGVYLGSFAAGYPLIDSTNHNVTIRAVVSSAQANGNTLTEFGIFNTDGTPMFYSHDTYSGIVKNNQIEIIYEQIDGLSNG